MAKREERYYTVEDYLALERAGGTRSEYLDGRIYPMAAATRNHERIVAHVIRELGVQLRRGPCQDFASNLRVRIPETGLYTYPDASVVCGEPRFEDGTSDTLLNPALLVEVLAPSTESYDRGEKSAHSRRITSLRAYVLIAQSHVRVEWYTRGASDDAGWTIHETTDVDATIELTSIGCTLAVRDVYDRVDLVPNPPLRAVQEPDAAYAAYAASA